MAYLKLKEVWEFGDTFWSYNVPVQFQRYYYNAEDPEDVFDEEASKVTKVLIYMPRKERCEWIEVNNEDLPVFIDNSIALLENAIRLIQEFKDWKSEHVYYLDILPDNQKLSESTPEIWQNDTK